MVQSARVQGRTDDPSLEARPLIISFGPPIIWRQTDHSNGTTYYGFFVFQTSAQTFHVGRYEEAAKAIATQQIQRPCRPRVPIHATVQVVAVLLLLAADPLATVAATVEPHLAMVEAATAALPKAMAAMAHLTPRPRRVVAAVVGWGMVVDSINNKVIVVRVWESMKISKR